MHVLHSFAQDTLGSTVAIGSIQELKKASEEEEMDTQEPSTLFLL